MYLASLNNSWSSKGTPSTFRKKFKSAGSEFCYMNIRDSLLKGAISIIDGPLGRSMC